VLQPSSLTKKNRSGRAVKAAIQGLSRARAGFPKTAGPPRGGDPGCRGPCLAPTSSAREVRVISLPTTTAGFTLRLRRERQDALRLSGVGIAELDCRSDDGELVIRTAMAGSAADMSTSGRRVVGQRWGDAIGPLPHGGLP